METPNDRFKKRWRTPEATWVFSGDSITHGMSYTGGGRSYVEHIQERVRTERRRYRHFFVNTAIGGDTAAGVLRMLDLRVLRFRPDFFSLMIGMNDCAHVAPDVFESNLRQIVQRVRQDCGAEIILQTAIAIDPRLTPERSAYQAFMDILRRVALETTCVLIDHQSSWESDRLADPADHLTRMADPIHPNASGHFLLAQKFLADTGIGALEVTPV